MPKSQKKKTSAYADAPFPVVGVGASAAELDAFQKMVAILRKYLTGIIVRTWIPFNFRVLVSDYFKRNYETAWW